MNLLAEEKNQKCEICGHGFRHIYSLKKHKRTVHLKEYPFPCSRCGKGFHTRALFKSHKCKPKIELQQSDQSPGELRDVQPSKGKIPAAAVFSN